MIERDQVINCLAITLENKFVEIPFESNNLVEVAQSKEIVAARKGNFVVTVGYQDSQGNRREAKVSHILVPYNFGIYLQNKDLIED